jgi:hypothetical protein
VCAQKTDSIYEVKKLTNEKERVEKKLMELNSEQLKNQGSQHTSTATINRLNTQINGMQSDMEVVILAKKEMEKIVEQQKNELTDAERKSTEYYH